MPNRSFRHLPRKAISIRSPSSTPSASINRKRNAFSSSANREEFVQRRACVLAIVASGIMAGPASAYTAYVSNEKDNTMTLVDTATLQVVGTLPSGDDPELFVLSPDGKTLYVANENDNLVTAIDVGSKEVKTEI